VLALACARLAASAHADPAVVEALSQVDSATEYRAEDWSLAREMAGLLAAHGARPAALKVYATLAKTKAPAPAARQTLLREARAVAESAGDEAQVKEFSRQLDPARVIP
jgi:hypothetical protein